jgi:hypothetical protein
MNEFAIPPSVRAAVVLVGVSVLVSACSEGTTEPDVPAPSTIAVSQTALGFGALGDTVRLSATVRDQNGDVLAGTPVTWSSSDASVATVSASGLVTSAGNGDAVVSVSAGEASRDVPVDVEQVADRLRFAPDPVTLAAVDDTVTVVATVVDANDFTMPTGNVTWGSDDPGAVEMSATGVATARSEGQTRITAEVDGVTGELAAFVGDAVVVVGSVSPLPLVEGSEAVVRGLGFAPAAEGNTVRVGGFEAAVTSASSVELRFTVPDTDCSPPREAFLRVDAGGMADSTVTSVHPGGLVTLAAGQGTYVTDGCVHLAAGDGDASYVVGVLSSSETPSSLTPARLAARAGSRTVTLATGPAPAGSAYPLSGGRFAAPELTSTSIATAPRLSGAAPSDLQATAAARAHRTGEGRVRAADRAWVESLGPITPSPSLAPARSGAAGAPPQLAEIMELLVPGDGCDLEDGTPVTAEVVYVGQSVAFLEDQANPEAGFTEAEYRDFDDFLTETTLSVLRDNFGEFSDVDENERVLVLVTQEVNKRENLAGFVFSGDLAPLVSATCPGANDAEIFYGLAPDPDGIANPDRKITKAALQLLYPPLIAHELTHVLQFVSIFREAGVFKSSWELEGGATLAEQLVGYEVFGEGPRLDLGYTSWRQGANEDEVPNWYVDWVVDMAVYFGFQVDNPPLEKAPEECSWVGRESEGNAGPCETGRAVYGVPSTLLRWIMDRYGRDAADDRALLRRITSSPFSGFATLEDATGEEIVDLLVPFAATLWADGNPALPEGQRDWLSSWNVYDVYANVNPDARLRPYVRDGVAEPQLDVSVRAASSAYLEWTPPLNHEPTSLRIRAPSDGGPLPEHMVLWVLRVR